jgi:hypothetical protein
MGDDTRDRVSMGHLGFEEIQIDHYESGSLPTGSVACLTDGRKLVTAPAFDILHDAYLIHKKAVIAARDASTTEISTCPFCKGIGYMNSVPHNANCADEVERDYYVRCNSCGCEGPWAKSETGAKRLWNMRTP